VRHILDLHHSTESIYGEITCEGSDHPESFTGGLNSFASTNQLTHGNPEAQ
jgi:hypothetical protein